MTKKIFDSIFSVALVVVLAGIGIATSFLYSYFNTSQVKQLKEELSLVADTVNEVGVEYFDNFNSSVFRFTVVDADGTVLYDTQVNPDEMENHADREEIAEAYKNGTGSSARNSSTLTEKTFYEAVRLKNGNVLRISVSQLTVGALIIGMLPAIFAIILIAAIVAAISFLGTLVTNASTFGVSDKMDKKGLVLNSAFAVSASFVFGSHLAFTMAFDNTYILPMIIGKLISGVCAVILAFLLYKDDAEPNTLNR